MYSTYKGLKELDCCPKCEGDGVLVYSGLHGSYVVCSDCGVFTDSYSDYELAIADWKAGHVTTHEERNQKLRTEQKVKEELRSQQYRKRLSEMTIKSCRWCDGQGKLMPDIAYGSVSGYYVACEKCKAHTAVCACETQVIEDWNQGLVIKPDDEKRRM